MGIKAIFLDIDGVLNFARCKAQAPSGCIGISDTKMKLLKEIVDRTNAKIILVSTWKFEWEKYDKENMPPDGKYLDKKMKKHGLEIYDKTYDRGFNRGEGIISYINDTEDYIDSWIVIDDEMFIDYEKEGIVPHWVHTDFSDNGLKTEHVEKAVSLLMGEP